MTIPTPRPAVDADDGDGALVRRLAEGDDGALEALYDRYGRTAFALACRVAGGPAAAEQVVREVFLELWREPGRYDPEHGGLPRWLLASTHRKAVEAARRQGTRPPPEPEPVPPAGAGEHGRRVRAALADLPAAQREAVALAYYTGRTQREIAERTGAPVGTVQTQLFAGMRMLRHALDRPAGAGGAR